VLLFENNRLLRIFLQLHQQNMSGYAGKLGLQQKSCQ